MKNKIINSFWLLSVALLCLGAANDALAQTCQITQPSVVGSNGVKGVVNSRYGMRTHPISGVQKMHTGTDINVPGDADCGAPVLQQAGCEKKEYGPRGGYGNQLKVDCGNGVVLTYSHLSGYNEATKTMFVGTTGSSTGCHLHYEAFIDGKRVDPECLWGTGRNCPTSETGTGATSITNTCDPDQKDALVNHETSVDDDPDDHDHIHDHDNEDTDDVGDVTSTIGTGDIGNPQVTPEPQPDPEETLDTPPTPSDEYEQEPTEVVCDNSTCITTSSVAVANHKDVKKDEVTTYIDLINVPESNVCKGVSKSGATVFRQVVGANGIGEAKEYPDTFCINQGCVYVNASKSGDGKCE